MSKLSPTGQSMAALFSPESEKIRKGETSAKGGGKANNASPKAQPGIPDAGKSQDSLGNPSGPLGYEPWKKEKEEEEEPSEAIEAAANGVPVFEVPGAPASARKIRLSAGWDKLLVTQKKICEKAKNLFTMLDAPVKYRVQKKSSMIQMKSRGSILNIDVAADAPQTEKKKEDEAA